MTSTRIPSSPVGPRPFEEEKKDNLCPSYVCCLNPWKDVCNKLSWFFLANSFVSFYWENFRSPFFRAGLKSTSGLERRNRMYSFSPLFPFLFVFLPSYRVGKLFFLFCGKRPFSGVRFSWTLISPVMPPHSFPSSFSMIIHPILWPRSGFSFCMVVGHKGGNTLVAASSTQAFNLLYFDRALNHPRGSFYLFIFRGVCTCFVYT